MCVCICQDRSISIAPRLQTGHPRNHDPISITSKNQLFSKVSRLVLKPTQFTTQRIMGGGKVSFHGSKTADP